MFGGDGFGGGILNDITMVDGSFSAMSINEAEKKGLEQHVSKDGKARK